MVRKKMSKERLRLGSAWCVLAVLSLFGGTGKVSLAYAAGTIQIEKTYETADKDDSGNGQFENVYEKDGVLYGLTRVTTEIVDTIETAGESYTYTSEIFIDEPEKHMPEQRVEKEDGIYELQKSELLTGKADGRSKYAETDITYQVEYIDNLPAEGTVTVRDEDTGIELQEKLPAIRTITGESYWDDNFSFPITIADYDAEAFLLGDILVPRGAALIDYADELLEHLALPEEYYQVEEIVWAGEEYDEGGMMFRDAVAYGKRKMTEVTVTYGGDIMLPAVDGQFYRCTYVKIGTATGTIYKVKAIATYEEESDVVQPKSFLDWLLDWILKHPIATLGIFLLLLLLVITIILYVLGKKEKGEEEPEIIGDDEEDETEEGKW